MTTPIDNPSAFERVGATMLKLSAAADKAPSKRVRQKYLFVWVALDSFRRLSKAKDVWIAAMARNEVSLSQHDARELLEACGGK